MADSRLFDGQGAPSSELGAAELAELIAVQRAQLEARRPCVPEGCAEMTELERTLAVLTERLRQVLPPGETPLSSLQAAARLAEPSELVVPPSHRSRGGGWVTAAKRAFVEGLQPLHLGMLRPQADFNQRVVHVLEQLSIHRGLGLREELGPWIRSRLRDASSLQEKALAPGRELAGRAYITALGPLLEVVLRGQSEWNAAMTEALLAAARPGALDEASATRMIASLDALEDPLRRQGLPLGVRATAPFWREVFRLQSRFNAEAVLALAGILGVRTPPPRPPSLADYEAWCERREVAQVEAARAAVAGLSTRPLFSLVVPVRGAPESLLRECLASMEAQVYPEWEVLLVVEQGTPPGVNRWLRAAARKQPRLRLVTPSERGSFARALNAGLSQARGDFVGVLPPRDTLAPHALAELALAAGLEVDLLYGDEDWLDASGRRSAPFFKPDWSPDLLRSVDYIGLFVVRRDLLEASGGVREGYEGAEGYELLLRLSERTGRIGHVPRLLHHRRSGPAGGGTRASEAGRRALAEHLARSGTPQAEVSCPVSGHYRVRYPVQGQPKVSIIVPFKDRPDLLQTLVSSLLARTTYTNYEVLLVSNNSTRPETFALLERLTEPRLVKLTWDFPFNYPAINNWAARQATGELLLFLNNDMEVVAPGWLDELVGQALRPEVGAVGAKLLFPEGTVQHAGVVVGISGFAGHPFWRLPDGPISTPFGHTEWVRNWLAVTSACVMVRRRLFEELGGFDERFLLCGSDMDLCLRMHQRGLRVLCTPFARLIHHESASRRSDAIPEIDYWLSYAAYRPWLRKGDPFYNPNLTLMAVDCDLRRHAEDGEALAVRTLGREVPSARHGRREQLVREPRHLLEHLGRLDCSEAEVEAHRRQAPEALRALRARGRVERLSWSLTASERLTDEVRVALRFAALLHQRHGVVSDFLVSEWPGVDARRFVRRAAADLPEGVGGFYVLGGPEALARLPACDLAIATCWASTYPVLRHPRSGVRAWLVLDDAALAEPAGALSALAERPWRFGLQGLFASQSLLEYATGCHGMDGCVFEPGVDGAFFQERPLARRGPVRVLFHGRPELPQEGFELGLAALAELQRELGPAVELLASGAEWSPESHGLRGRVTNLGVLPAERAAAIYRECDVGLGFSFSRRPSFALREMMASGMAVVSNDGPALHGLLRHEEDGLLTPASLPAVVEQLRRVVREPELRNRLGSAAARRMHGATWEAAVDGVMAALLSPGRERV